MRASQLVFALTLVCLALSFLFARLDLSHLWATLQDFVDLKTYEWFIDDCRAKESVPDHGNTLTNDHDEVHVVYAADTNGFQALLSSMLSLSRHLEAPGRCVIHLILHPFDMERAARLVQCFQVELDELGGIPVVKMHELQPLPINITGFKETWEDVWPSGARFLTPLYFVQMYLHEYLPTQPRVVWLNVDTIVRADLRRLYNTPMRSPLAATLDSKCVTWRSEYVRELEEVDPTLLQDVPDIDARTLNSGVVVFDLERWRKEGLAAKLEAWVLRASGVKTVQLALNLEFRDRFDILDWRWNVMGLMMVPPRRCVDEAKILHWTGGKVTPFQTNLSLRPRLQALYDELTGSFVPAVQCRWQGEYAMLDTDVGA